MELVPQREGSAQHSSEYRTVAVYWTRAEAELARGMLEADGIPAAFRDGADAALLPGTRALRLMVPAMDLDRSRDILATPEPAHAAEPPAPAVPARDGWGVTWLVVWIAAFGLAGVFALGRVLR
ncbi:conserved hypothetical protein [Anaeromyxobacter sp. K]|uniref:DUF2007 domain-containing protein n=1 Tax=Anaeromyxobacter dehalogenans (strain ATCC BAA-258 / DSM 21875 / 2CP-1) TaxID=455488 RepID=B8J7F2_ANAD2|nr:MULTISPECIES: DUF2007 domain-containing protein [Anaeromyxobacter]ACG74936.1 conserved hypothetical protein [Anaeromyxobacter sp. K]ACL67132.1 conserved hypothetical protein [Anaeromyxobacter dehalogenans 2CP-1]